MPTPFEQKRTKNKVKGQNYQITKSKRARRISKLKIGYCLLSRLETDENYCSYEALNENQEKVIINFGKSGAFKNEIKFYKAIHWSSNERGFPRLLDLRENKYYSVLVRGYVGESIHDKLNSLKILPIRMKTVLQFGIQMVERLKVIHERGFVHGNLTLHNIEVKSSSSLDCDLIYVSDFRYARKWRTEDGRHIELKTRRDEIPIALTFCSIGFHRGLELSRKDDIESLIYIMILMMKRKLPWQYLQKFKKNSLKDDIKDLKMNPMRSKLFKGLPSALEEIWDITQSMSFSDRPSYSNLIKRIKEGIKEIGAEDDGVLTWTY